MDQGLGLSSNGFMWRCEDDQEFPQHLPNFLLILKIIIYSYFMCMNSLPDCEPCVCVCVVPAGEGCWEGVLGPLELEFLTSVSRHVGAEKQIQVLC